MRFMHGYHRVRRCITGDGAVGGVSVSTSVCLCRNFTPWNLYTSLPQTECKPVVTSTLYAGLLARLVAGSATKKALSRVSLITGGFSDITVSIELPDQLYVDVGFTYHTIKLKKVLKNGHNVVPGNCCK